MYAEGRGGPPSDDAQAVEWFRKAAEQGDAWAQGRLGLMYDQGRGGLSRDDAQAVAWYRKAAEQGNAWAQGTLGARYAEGRGGLPRDDTQAVAWYRKAAEQGNAWAQGRLGLMYAEGRGGLPRDDAQAVAWYRKAAKQGNALAQGRLGRMYAKGRGGLPRDDVQAFAWYHKAAEQGNALAQGHLGLMYAEGRGGLSRDDAQAVAWYRKAAAQDHAWGQLALGFMYAEGRGGLPRDDAQAVAWYRKAAEQGHAWAQRSVGLMYAEGRGGLSRDDAQAVAWYRKSAEQGDAWAQGSLGVMYAEGRGVPRDAKRAFDLLTRASQSESERTRQHAQRSLSRLKSQLSWQGRMTDAASEVSGAPSEVAPLGDLDDFDDFDDSQDAHDEPFVPQQLFGIDYPQSSQLPPELRLKRRSIQVELERDVEQANRQRVEQERDEERAERARLEQQLNLLRQGFQEPLPPRDVELAREAAEQHAEEQAAEQHAEGVYQAVRQQSSTQSAQETKPNLQDLLGISLRFKRGPDDRADGEPPIKRYRTIVANKFAIAIAPSIDMNIAGQDGPSSGLWDVAIQDSPVIKCQHALLGLSASLDELRREEIKDGQGILGPSLEQLERLVRSKLPDVMKFDGEPLPTSLLIIAHGSPGHIRLGQESVPVLTLVKRIQQRLEWRAALQHIHFDSCSALQGISSEDLRREGIRGIAITGFTIDIGVEAAQGLGQKLVSKLSLAVETTSAQEWARSGLSVGVLARAKALLQEEVGQSSRQGGGSQEAQHLLALEIVGN